MADGMAKVSAVDLTNTPVDGLPDGGGMAGLDGGGGVVIVVLW
jgi:hypothetical protein